MYGNERFSEDLDFDNFNLSDYGLREHREKKILIRLDSEAQHFKFQPDAVLINKFDVFTKTFTAPTGI
jgi:predicted nucleotidyltransferase component of viral defense system